MNKLINTLPQGSVLHGKSYSYCIEKVLGQGSFGITYLASVKMQGELGSLNTNVKVAIKEFFMKELNGREGSTVTSGSKGGLFADYRKKFVREATNLSKLQHPNIIKVLECFEANNTVYYVMEYLDGGDLDTLIESHGRLSEKEAVRYAKQIGTALSFMHQNKMLHLDLKPKNVMLNANNEAVLIDFGLSKQYDSSGEPESSTTVGAGTPGYAPIEQANYHDGQGFPVTMDIYALGATLYKMLTGTRPPASSEVLNDGLSIPSYISSQLCGTIAAAMQPVRKNRPQSVTEWLQLLPEDIEDDDEVTIVTENATSPKNTFAPEIPNRVSFAAFSRRGSIVDIDVVYDGRNYVVDYEPLEEVRNYSNIDRALQRVTRCHDVVPCMRELQDFLNDPQVDYIVIAYNSLSDYIYIQNLLQSDRIKKVKVVREMELWALCKNRFQNEILEIRSGDAYCICEYDQGLAEILETGYGSSHCNTPAKTCLLDTKDDSCYFAYFVVGAWIQYSILMGRYENEILLLNSFPFNLQAFIFQDGKVRDVIALLKKPHQGIPCKFSETLNYGTDCKLKIKIEDLTILNVDCNPNAYSITVEINNIIDITVKDASSGAVVRLC